MYTIIYKLLWPFLSDLGTAPGQQQFPNSILSTTTLISKRKFQLKFDNILFKFK